LLHASQSGLLARHSMTLQWMRLTDHVTLNFSNSILGYRKSLWHYVVPCDVV